MMNDGVKAFERMVADLGAEGMPLAEQVMQRQGFLDLDPGERAHFRQELRRRFGDKEFRLRDAVSVALQTAGSWDLIGGAAARDWAELGASVALFVSATAEGDFSWRVDPETSEILLQAVK